MGHYTDLFFSRPSFLAGIARIFDFAGSIETYQPSLTPDEADRLALQADWYAVGEDMRRAIVQRAAELGLESVHGPDHVAGR